MWQKDLNWFCRIQGWWHCYPGFPGCKVLQVNVIFSISSPVTQACSPNVLVHNTEIKLYQQTPDKTNLSHSDIPTTHTQQSPKKDTATVWKQNIIIQEKLWIPIGASLWTQAGARDFSAGINYTWKVIKILLWWTTVWSQQMDSRKL